MPPQFEERGLVSKLTPIRGDDAKLKMNLAKAKQSMIEKGKTRDHPRHLKLTTQIMQLENTKPMKNFDVNDSY